LADLRRREDALAAIEEAVTIRRELAAAQPTVFRERLAGSLDNLASVLAALGRDTQAAAARAEAAGIREEFSSPDRI